MNQLTEFPTSAPEPSPVSASVVTVPDHRAPYVAPHLETHGSWVLTTGISGGFDGSLSSLAGRDS